MDETQSDEQAFPTTGMPKEVFQFDEQAAPASSPEENADSTQSSSSDEKDEVVTAPSDSVSEDDEEKRVPYSRFKKKLDEAEAYAETVKALESRLASLESARNETRSEDVEMPPEWIQLYGDSDVAKNAWKVQTLREQKLREESVKEAIAFLKKEQEAQKQAEAQNEDALDEYLSSLQDSAGKPISSKMEEEILSIVDEFSPTGEDGKYLSMISPEKALEIYKLRSAVKSNTTAKAREKLAALSNGSSEGEPDASSDTTFKRGWDNWREAL